MYGQVLVITAATCSHTRVHVLTMMIAIMMLVLLSETISLRSEAPFAGRSQVRQPVSGVNPLAVCLQVSGAAASQVI